MRGLRAFILQKVQALVVERQEKKFCYPSLKFVHFKKSVTRSSFLAKSVVIFSDFVFISVKMTTLFSRNDNCVTDFLK